MQNQGSEQFCLKIRIKRRPQTAQSFSQLFYNAKCLGPCLVDTFSFKNTNEMGPRRIFTENYVPNHYLGAPREHFVLKTRTSGRLYHSRLHSDEHFGLKTRTRGRLYRSRLHSGDHFGLKIRTRGRLYHSRLQSDEHFWLKNTYQRANGSGSIVFFAFPASLN